MASQTAALAYRSPALSVAADIVKRDGKITVDNELPIIEAAKTRGDRGALRAMVDSYKKEGQIDTQAINDLRLASFSVKRVTADDLKAWHTPFAEAWPVDQVYTTKAHGIQTPAQFEIYEAKWGALGGTFDLKGATDYLKGSGFKPLVGEITQPDGSIKQVAFGEMLMNTASKTSMGHGYNEMIPCIYTVPDNTPDAASTMPYVNSASDVLGVYPRNNLTAPPGTLFATKPILDSQGAVDYGRELMGFDKSLGRLSINEVGNYRYFKVTDEFGDEVVSGRLLSTPSKAQTDQAGADMVAAANAAGIPLAMLSAPMPPKQVGAIASRIPGRDVSLSAAPGTKTGPTVQTALALGSFAPVAVHADAKKDMHIHWGNSRWAKLIHGQLGFEPNESITTETVQAALQVKVP